ncbi:MAG: DUF4339 domain-containing protein [Bacteroidales bacterium]|nr:DUF4339 domain-containing protein [Bacteroidales bacterium]
MKFYIIKDDLRLGPFTLEEVKQQGLASDTLVWHKGMPDWKEACTVPELVDAIVPSVPDEYKQEEYSTPEEVVVDDCPPIPEPPQPRVQPRRYSYAPTPAPMPAEPEKKSKAGVIALASVLVVLIILCIMMLTKPSRADYIDTITRNTTEYIVERIDDSAHSASETLAGTAKFATSKAVSAMLEHGINVDDYFIFNTASVKIGDRTFTVGFGMFSHVFTFDKEDLAKAVNEYLERERAKENNSTIEAVQGAVDDAIEFGKQTAEKQGIDEQDINNAVDTIKQRAIEKGGEIVDEVMEKAKEKGKEAIEDLLN